MKASLPFSLFTKYIEVTMAHRFRAHISMTHDVYCTVCPPPKVQSYSFHQHITDPLSPSQITLFSIKIYNSPPTHPTQTSRQGIQYYKGMCYPIIYCSNFTSTLSCMVDTVLKYKSVRWCLFAKNS